VLHPHTDRLDGTAFAGGDEAYPFHLLSYLVSNAAAAEAFSMESSAEMVQLLPTTRARIDMVDAAKVAGDHVLVLGKLGRVLGLGAGRALVEPFWHGVRRHARSAVARKDLAACLILQDAIAGALAVTIHDTLASAGDLDPRAATIATGILADSFERLEAGTWHLRTLLAQDPEGTVDALRWSHHRAMPELRGRIDQDCAELCADGACDSTATDYIARDVAALKQRAAGRYAETLRVLFDPSVVRPLLAGLAGHGGGGRLPDGAGGQSGDGAAPHGQAG
jgi:hypothetical protein